MIDTTMDLSRLERSSPPPIHDGKEPAIEDETQSGDTRGPRNPQQHPQKSFPKFNPKLNSGSNPENKKEAKTQAEQHAGTQAEQHPRPHARRNKTHNADYKKKLHKPHFDRAIGNLPPIMLDGVSYDHILDQKILLRWLGISCFIVLLAAVFLGSLFYALYDSQILIKEPITAQTRPKPDSNDAGINQKKSDRLYHPLDIIAAKQSLKLVTTIKSGNRDIIKPRKFTRVSTELVTSPNEFADNVPKFNANKILANNAQPLEALQSPEPNNDDAEVALTSQPLLLTNQNIQTLQLSTEEARQQINEVTKQTSLQAELKTEPKNKAINKSDNDQIAMPIELLAARSGKFQTNAQNYAQSNSLGALSLSLNGTARDFSRFSSPDVRMVPENVSTIKKTPSTNKTSEERVITVRKGEGLEDILRLNGATPQRIKAIMDGFGAKRGEAVVSEGQRVRLLLFAAGTDDTTLMGPVGAKPVTMQIMRVTLYDHDRASAKIALNDKGEAANLTTNIARATTEDTNDADAMRLFDSLYETGLKQGLTSPMIEELVANFASDIDFQQAVNNGDRMEVFFSEPDDNAPNPEILFAALSVNGQKFQYYRYQSPDDGMIDYYDANGRSARKFLVRKPIVSGELRSTYGMRYHPILHYSRLHSGIDWSAPIGTPIFAAGTGTITSAEWDSGYGRRVEIQHANGYQTTYSHMSAFAKGIHPGLAVRQGQIIGYLGKSGLATGPHLHYEVLVNDRYVDPLAIKLARTREFSGKQLADFQQERARIDDLMARVAKGS